MEQEIKYIQIGLENVEVINIDVKNIEYMSLHGIADRDTISRCDKKVARSKCCQSLHICINKKQIRNIRPMVVLAISLYLKDYPSSTTLLISPIWMVIRTELNQLMFLGEIKLPTTHGFLAKLI